MANALTRIISSILPSPVKLDRGEENNVVPKAFKITFTMAHIDYSGEFNEGDDLHEFFLGLGIPTIKAKVHVRLEVKKGHNTFHAEEDILPFPMKRIMQNKLAKELLIKKLVAKLK